MATGKTECLAFISDARDDWPEALLIERYEELIGAYGFNSYLLTELPLVPNMGPDDLFIRNNWAPEWWDQYIRERFFLVDPISMASFVENRPFYWSDAVRKYGVSLASQRVMAEAAEFGLREGLTFAFSDGQHWRSVVSVGRNDMSRLAEDDVGLLYLASIHFGMAMSAHKAPARSDRLSEREREILLWVACGKTAWEIGQILTISKNTIDRHLYNIRRKLKATTNAHAVSLAIVSGHLHP